MARYKPYDYDQLIMVPVSLEEQLMPGTLEFAIHHVIEERLDLSMFDNRYCNDETGRKAIDPKVLIKIVLFGYSRGMISSRSLEQACRENITSLDDIPNHGLSLVIGNVRIGQNLLQGDNSETIHSPILVRELIGVATSLDDQRLWNEMDRCNHRYSKP